MGMGPGPRRRRGHRCRTPCLLVALVAAMLVTSGQQPGATAEYPNFRAWCADRATAAASGQPGAAGSDPYTQALKCGGGYKWMIPEGRYNLGIMDGNQARLRAAAHRFIEKGAHLTVGFIGAWAGVHLVALGTGGGGAFEGRGCTGQERNLREAGVGCKVRVSGVGCNVLPSAWAHAWSPLGPAATMYV